MGWVFEIAAELFHYAFGLFPSKHRTPLVNIILVALWIVFIGALVMALK